MANAVARPPRPSELKPYVRLIWCYSTDESWSYELVMPGGAGQLIVTLAANELRHWAQPGVVARKIGPLGLQGVLTRPVVIDTDQKREVCGVAFHYCGLCAFHDLPAKVFTHTLVEGSAVFGESAQAIRSALCRTPGADQRIELIEAHLLRHLRRRPREDALVQLVAMELAQGARVSEIQARFGLSQRLLHDLSIVASAYAPRCSRASNGSPPHSTRCRTGDAGANSHLSMGFADQAHFIREFNQLSGSSPSQHAMLPGETWHARPSADKIFNTSGIS